MVSGIGVMRKTDGNVQIAIGKRHPVKIDDVAAWFSMPPDEAVEFAGMLLRAGTEHLREEKDADQGSPKLPR